MAQGWRPRRHRLLIMVFGKKVYRDGMNWLVTLNCILVANELVGQNPLVSLPKIIVGEHR